MGLVRGGAIDYATKGIRINAVLPGGTLTPMLKGAMANDPGLEPALASVHPMNRFGQPEEIAAAVRFLISDEASFVTGRSEEHTSELQSLMRISYAGFCLKTQNTHDKQQ